MKPLSLSFGMASALTARRMKEFMERKFTRLEVQEPNIA
jgi:hypothetical protein